MLVLIGFAMLFGGCLLDILLHVLFKLNFHDENNSMDVNLSPGNVVQILSVILMFVGLITSDWEWIPLW